jgi:hypothetical protein
MMMSVLWNSVLLADLVSGLDAGQRTGILIVAISCGTAVILGLAGIILSGVNSIHRRRTEVDFKRELVERGMSADEIATVIESAPPLENATDRWIASWADKNKKKTG